MLLPWRDKTHTHLVWTTHHTCQDKITPLSLWYDPFDKIEHSLRRYPTPAQLITETSLLDFSHKNLHKVNKDTHKSMCYSPIVLAATSRPHLSCPPSAH